MNKKTKHIFSCFIVVLMMLMYALPFTAFATEAEAVPEETVLTQTSTEAEPTADLTESEPAAEASAEETHTSTSYGTWLALLPPVIAIALALITKEVYSSLFVGLIAGGLLYSNFNPIIALDSILSDGIIAAVSGTAGIFVFLVVLGILVALINKAGGSQAFGKWAEKNIKSRVGATLATFLLGVLIFIDDYFNCLTVGSVMRPATDTHKISRAKLSYIIDATAAPICMIAPISSWAAAVSDFAPEGQGLSLFIRAIPYNFYSLLTLVFIVAITLMKFDFGPMRIHEERAIKEGKLFVREIKDETENIIASSRGRVIDLVLPIVLLVGICVFALVYVGGMFDGLSFVDAFANTDATVGLPWGSIIALVITIIYLIARRLVTFKEAMECVPAGFNAMVPAILILTFATALKNITTIIGSAEFVDAFITQYASGFANFLPAIIFLVACFISFSTGTSWGTFGILIPIVVAVFPENSELLIIGMSACLAGSVCGDHISPISDTTIMSSAGAKCDHIDHISTQIPYALVVAAISFVGYILAGIVQNVFIVLPLTIVITIATLFIIKKITVKN